MVETALETALKRKQQLEAQIRRMTEGGWKTDERYETNETHEEYVERLKGELKEAESEIENLKP